MQWDDGAQRRVHLGGGHAVDPHGRRAHARGGPARRLRTRCLHFVHDAIALRRRTPDLLGGDYQGAPGRGGDLGVADEGRPRSWRSTSRPLPGG